MDTNSFALMTQRRRAESRQCSDSLSPQGFVDPSDLTEDVFITRSKRLLSERWYCAQPGHSLCFVDGSFHGSMTEVDVNTWAGGMAAGKETVDRPPSPIFERLLSMGYRPGRPAAVPDNFSDASPSSSAISLSSSQSLTTTDSDSLSSHSLDLAAALGIPGLGLTAGRGIEGLGNLILTGAAALHWRYRRKRLRAVMFTLKWADRNARLRGLHRVLSTFIAPGRQLYSLMDDIIESRRKCAWTIFDNRMNSLAKTLDRNKIPLATYARMKWLAITASYWWDEEEINALFSAFSGEFDDEGTAVSAVRRRLRHRYPWRLRDGDSPNERLMAFSKLLFAQTGRDLDALLAQCGTQWHDALMAGSIADTRYSAFRHLNDIFGRLSDIHHHDPNALFDADPSSDLSFWKEACDALGVMRRERWSPAELIWYHVAYLVNIMANTHPIRHTSLRATNALVSLVVGLPDERWEELVADVRQVRFLEERIPGLTLEDTPQSVEHLKSFALQLAYDF